MGLAKFIFKKEVMTIKNWFPNELEKNFLIFLYDYHFLKIDNAVFLFDTMQYYKRQLSSLIKYDYIRKHHSGCYILGDTGKKYLKNLGYDLSTKMPYSQKYIDRQTLISYIAAFYHYNKNIEFIPSFKLKEKDVFTIRSRRYIGLIKTNQKEYLTYYISKEQDKKYIESVFFDIQKEQKYRNIIIFSEDISKISLKKFSYGLNEVLVIKPNIQNLEKLQYINKIDWSKVVRNKLGNSVFLSEYNFCEYTNKKDKYILCFYFIDTEKINLIKYFLRENENIKATIVCSKEIVDNLKQELPSVEYIVVELDLYIVKGEFNIYE